MAIRVAKEQGQFSEVRPMKKGIAERVENIARSRALQLGAEKRAVRVSNWLNVLV
jgi:hypothetical protein